MMILISTVDDGPCAIDAARITAVSRNPSDEWFDVWFEENNTLNYVSTAEPINGIVRRINAARQGYAPALPPNYGA